MQQQIQKLTSNVLKPNIKINKNYINIYRREDNMLFFPPPSEKMGAFTKEKRETKIDSLNISCLEHCTMITREHITIIRDTVKD